MAATVVPTHPGSSCDDRPCPPPAACPTSCNGYNGWCTSRRFQSHSPCLFGCCYGEDSVDHYMRCSRLHDVGNISLRFQASQDMGLRALQFFLLEPAALIPDATLHLRALHLAAAYRLHCRCRREPPILSADILAHALGQAAKEAAMGHANAMKGAGLHVDIYGDFELSAGHVRASFFVFVKIIPVGVLTLGLLELFAGLVSCMPGCGPVARPLVHVRFPGGVFDPTS